MHTYFPPLKMWRKLKMFTHNNLNYALHALSLYVYMTIYRSAIALR